MLRIADGSARSVLGANCRPDGCKHRSGHDRVDPSATAWRGAPAGAGGLGGRPRPASGIRQASRRRPRETRFARRLSRNAARSRDRGQLWATASSPSSSGGDDLRAAREQGLEAWAVSALAAWARSARRVPRPVRSCSSSYVPVATGRSELAPAHPGNGARGRRLARTGGVS